MKCYYREGDGPWLKGHIESHGRQVFFHSRDEAGAIQHQVSFYDPEVMFHGPYMTVTGFLKIKDEDGKYRLISLDVSGGWVKPHK